MIQAYDAARMRIEMMARILAECGVKEIFRDIHETMCKHVDRPRMMKLNGQWQMIDPRQWKTRTDMDINVGIGHATRERKLMSIQDMIQTQQIGMQAGVVSPQNLLFAFSEKAKCHGFDPQQWFSPPPPPQPPPPDATMMMVEVERERNQIRAQEIQVKMLEAQGRAQTAQMEAQERSRRQQVDEQSQIANAQTMAEKVAAEAALKASQQQFEQFKFMMEQRLARYEADLDATVELQKLFSGIDGNLLKQLIANVQKSQVGNAKGNGQDRD